MRYTNRATAAVAVGLTAVLALAGCSKKSEGTSVSTGSAGGSSSSAQVKVAFVPKLQGIPYFEAMNTGGQKAAQDLGLEWIYKGPTTADPGAQTEIVKSLIQQKVDVLVVAPNDPDSMAPILADAKSKGIRVMTSDTDAPNSVRELFVNQATAEGIGQGLTDALLCQLTADAAGKPVVAGPVEATALGNLLVQARTLGAVSGDLAALRGRIRARTRLHRYEPRG